MPDVSGLSEEAVKVLEGLYPGGCREWIDEEHSYCFAQSEFVLWGSLFPPKALGPRCYNHAAKHTDSRTLTSGDAAIIDLRPLLALLRGGGSGV